MTIDSLDKPALSSQQEKLANNSVSKLGAFSLYKEMTVGEEGLLFLFFYELVTGIGNILPGILGYGFRSIFYPLLFSSTSGGLITGSACTIRNPKGISFGRKVFLDDRVTVDCRKGSTILLSDHVTVGKDTILAAKGGDLHFDKGVNIGTQCRIATQSGVLIGESTLIAAYCYIGPGNHKWDEEKGSYNSGDMELKGGTHIGKNVWIGARSTILDGITIGDGAVIAAHSFVNKDVPAGATVAGVPAKVM